MLLTRWGTTAPPRPRLLTPGHRIPWAQQHLGSPWRIVLDAPPKLFPGLGEVWAERRTVAAGQGRRPGVRTLTQGLRAL